MSSNCNHANCREVCHRKYKPKKIYTLRRTPLKKAFKPKVMDEELEKFFYDCACIIEKNSRCCECGEYIPREYYRHATAHIIDKGRFPSVATHPLNWMQYGSSCGCHSDSHVMEKFSKMRTFPIAVEKFRQFEHLITEKHSYLDLFKFYADKINPQRIS